MDQPTMSVESFYSLLFAGSVLSLLIGFLAGLIFDKKIRRRNRRKYDDGGQDEMLDDPKKTSTKCGLPHCRDDRDFLKSMANIKTGGDHERKED